ncbi:MAG: ABC transporter permease [Xanthomonadales bacterium]|nr:ABC transporter permease [Xanthomonadales bacterium]
MNRRVRTTTLSAQASAKPATPRGWPDAMRAWLRAHGYSALSSLGRLAARPASSALSIGVMAVALALPLCLWVALANVQRLSGSIEQSRQLSVFMQLDLDVPSIESTAEVIRTTPGVRSLTVQTAAQGLAEFRALAGFDEALDLLDENPIPAVLLVGLDDRVEPEVLQGTFQQLPGVDAVQFDAEWQRRLESWLYFGQQFTMTVAALLGFGALLVVGNSIRLAIDGRAEEIEIMQLLGGSDAFVRRPYLYLGCWMGCAAGAASLLVLQTVLWALQGSVTALISAYGAGFQLRGLGMLHGLAVWALAACLGWLGAWLAAGHWLRRHRSGS